MAATTERVTLSDFHRLQQSLLETRQELYDCGEELQRARRRADAAEAAMATANAAAIASLAAASYPEELNPFGGGCSAALPAPTLGMASHTGSSHATAAIHAARKAAQLLAVVQQRWLIRLIFHAWRSSHSQTCILRNMSNMMQARASGDGGAAATPLAAKPACTALLDRVVAKGERKAAGNGQGHHGSSDDKEVDTVETLRAEVVRLESELARTSAARDALQERCRAGTQALRELCVTAAAMHGRALFGLEDAGLDDAE